MRILVESTLNYLNMGDLAMLQVCLRRLRCLWPEARIQLFTTDPVALRAKFPDIIPAFSDARDLWLRSLRSQPLAALARQYCPALYASILSGNLRRNPAARELLANFLSDLRNTDLFVIAGMGSFTSAFEPAVFNMFETIPLMKAFGIPVVAFSQGIGPIDRSSATWPIARRALNLMDFLTLREGSFGPALLRDLGVAEERSVVTGDDSIELAYRDQPLNSRALLGVNLRVTGYSGFTAGDSELLAQAITRVAVKLRTELVPVPISHVPEESDLDTYTSAFPRNRVEGISTLERTTDWLVDQVSKCRVVITGSYHGAVFALSQGIPAICLWKSKYYEHKFLGLAAQFGLGCRVLGISEPGFERALMETAAELWARNLIYRPSLLKAAREQIEASKAAWAELPFRLPNTKTFRKGAAGAQSSVPEAKVEICTWYRYRNEKLVADLRDSLAYLREVERARDWHAERADRLQAQIDATSNLVYRREGVPSSRVAATK